MSREASALPSREAGATFRLLRRREAIVALGGAGLGAIAMVFPAIRRIARAALGPAEATAAATCVLAPAQTEGPFYVAGSALRRNVVEARPGIPLWVSLKVVAVGDCAGIPGAIVEIWHADAGGDYSGFGADAGQTFLRGRQTVGASGVATFRTVYPGWYPGRTPHIHVKVRVGGGAVHTGQVYFAEEVTDSVYAQEPYVARGDRDTRNASDGIYAAGGAASLLRLAKRGKGWWGAITLAVAS